MTPENIVTMIEKHGLPLIVAGIFLYFIIRLLDWLMALLKALVNNWKNNKTLSHDEALDIREKVGVEINDLLQSLTSDTNSNRVQVIEFSNSVQSVAFLPFRYMTCTYEVYKLGMSGIGHRIDHISTSLFSDFFQSLERTPTCSYQLTDKAHGIGGAMYDIMGEDGSDRALCSRIVSDKGKFIGYVVCMKNEPFTKDQADKLEVAANQISCLLGVLDK